MVFFARDYAKTPQKECKKYYFSCFCKFSNSHPFITSKRL